MPEPERYLIAADLGRVPQLTADVVVLGGGIAGLSAALAASAEAQVLLITKDDLGESATRYAQGGIAAALDPTDSPALHLADTLAAGQGLCDEAAVQVMVEEGVTRCRELIEWETPFDQAGGGVAFTMEGAHSRRRVLHASDATGLAIAETLTQRVRATKTIQVLEGHFAIDLLHLDGVCHGVLMIDSTYGRLMRVRAPATILATGGLGQVFRETTNPAIATGDGYAMALRAGAVLRDMEFVQFHPTTLYLAGAPRFLISESVRGEGAHLINEAGERFMSRYDARGELAPRDVVSRSMIRELQEAGATSVYLDLRQLDTELIDRRFPTIQGICADFGLDIKRDPIPVRPAVHYMMGGVATDRWAQTNVRGLLAAGEVACTGVHGANRLASNSLLEGLVYGWRAGRRAVRISEENGLGPAPVATQRHHLKPRQVPLNLDDALQSLKALTWRNLGVFRDAHGLEHARRTLQFWENYLFCEQFQARRGLEVQNLLMVAQLIARAAALRTESRGAHQRSDYPETDPAWNRHVDLTLDDLASETEASDAVG